MVKHDHILDMYKYTYDGEKFLQVDTGKNDESRIIIFTEKKFCLILNDIIVFFAMKLLKLHQEDSRNPLIQNLGIF